MRVERVGHAFYLSDELRASMSPDTAQDCAVEDIHLSLDKLLRAVKDAGGTLDIDTLKFSTTRADPIRATVGRWEAYANMREPLDKENLMAAQLPLSASRATLDSFLKWCVAEGYRVGENPRFGTKTVTRGVHMSNSLHYNQGPGREGEAADINYGVNGPAERAKLIVAQEKAQSMGLAVTYARYGTEGSAKTHQNHLHVDRGVWCNLGKGLFKVSAPVAPAPTPPATSNGIKWLGHDRGVLVVGSQGPRVKALQEHLNKNYPAYSKLDPDSDYGNSVATVVKEFQRRANLFPDGEAGPATFKKLGLTF